MLFDTAQFAVFFVGVLAVTLVLRHRVQNAWLLLASYSFYGAWDPRFLGLIFLSTGIDFVVGRRLARTESPSARRRLLVLSVGSNLGILGFFKYCDFFRDNFVDLVSTFGWTVDAPTLSVVLPVGISFYTLQSMTYTIDIYRGQAQPTDRFVDFALFVSFFPQLVAGPIERSRDLLPQIERPRRPSWDDWCQGAALFGIGLFKKVAIADAVAGYVDHAYGNTANLHAIDAWVAVFAFSLQIYADFSGYSDMARGIARFLGFRLSENFQQPYFSRGIAEFWRRWHITLSRWLRDYVYIPLGGNRRGERRTLIHLMATMLIGGLWHGASWNFVLWGGLHGAYLSIERTWLKRTGHESRPTAPWASVLFVFTLVSLTWIPFRAESFAAVGEMGAGLIGLGAAAAPVATTLTAIHLAVLSLLLFVVIDRPQLRTSDHTAVLNWTLGRRVAFWSCLVLAVLVVQRGEANPFIYFQF